MVLFGPTEVLHRGLRIDQEGDFEDLGRVACKTNILLKARLLDACNTVSYDQSTDVYRVMLRGKKHKRASTPASPVLTPRVTHVQQILAVDLFFIKKLPFLLGELVPFELAICIPTKNRTAPVIAAGIRSFINTARSRDFDCVQLRNDGEGALYSST
jgi:hypothetical protein